jgi:hypothetical protein
VKDGKMCVVGLRCFAATFYNTCLIRLGSTVAAATKTPKGKKRKTPARGLSSLAAGSRTAWEFKDMAVKARRIEASATAQMERKQRKLEAHDQAEPKTAEEGEATSKDETAKKGSKDQPFQGLCTRACMSTRAVET